MSMSYRSVELVQRSGIEGGPGGDSGSISATGTRPKGILIVSLDFELYWGVRDIAGLDRYKDRLLAARAAVPGLLKLFADYQLHATWATVGMLFFGSKRDLLRSIPTPLPQYSRSELSPYQDLEDLGSDEYLDPYHYGQSLIQAIASTPHQEIGTHTFSHFYCLEDGQNCNTFRADLKAAVSAAKRLGVDIRSLVFPRNQVNQEYLTVCAELGIKAYRGNNAGWMYAPRPRHKESVVRRGTRLIDFYLNLSGHNTYNPNDAWGTLPVNVPSSRYLWMGSRWLRLLEPIRMRRMREEMSYAARHGRIYHLWFHPEDVGLDMERNLSFVRRVLDLFAGMREKGAIESLNMNEFVQRFERPVHERSSDNECNMLQPQSGGFK